MPAGGGAFITFVSSMDFIRDIFVNLLSNAIWAIGGFIIARMLFKKGQFISLIGKQLFLKKSIRCDLLSKKPIV
jgi:hypothetical protein